MVEPAAVARRGPGRRDGRVDRAGVWRWPHRCADGAGGARGRELTIIVSEPNPNRRRIIKDASPTPMSSIRAALIARFLVGDLTEKVLASTRGAGMRRHGHR
jgi:hypothetical protein